MTFVVNEDGVVHEKDLGKKTDVVGEIGTIHSYVKTNTITGQIEKTSIK